MSFRTRLFLVSAAVALSTLALAAWPLATEWREASVWAILVGVLTALGGAFAGAWGASRHVNRRTDAIAETARQYAAGNVVFTGRDLGDDEVGRLGKALDLVAQSLGQRVKELLGKQARTDAILKEMAEGVLVIDGAGRVQVVNDSLRSMLGIEGEATGRHYVELIRHPVVAQLLTTGVAGQKTSPTEVTLSTDPPKVLLASAQLFTVDSERGVALVLHDVTEYRRAAQVRENFVSNVSHELRTPLTSIRGSVEALLEQGPSPGDQRFLSIIARNSSRMERLVHDLLRLVRLDVGQETLEVTDCSVHSVFESVLTEVAPMVEAKQQRAETIVPEEAATVRADPVKLHDALRNLVENAVNYAPMGSSIELAVTGDDAVTCLTVADRGPGIPSADLIRVFERFYRVEDARARDHDGGTGLGLAIVKHLVGLHGGTVQAANREGGGSVFTIELPKGQGVAEA